MSDPSNEVLDYYVGWDASEVRAYDVCRQSVIRHCSKPIHLVAMMERALRFIGLYDRPWEVREGQKYDVRDGKPFSTEFSFTRFLVPAMQQYQGWALFSDCDFLWTADLADLFALSDETKAVFVVKHQHVPTETDKMAGAVQTKYHRKNWSSLVLWNCAHPSNKYLTVQAVNHEPGQWLHAFGWLRDEEIGELPQTWNWLSGVNEMPPMGEDAPKGIHFTLGSPFMKGYEQYPYAERWRQEEARGRKLLPREWKVLHGAT